MNVAKPRPFHLADFTIVAVALVLPTVVTWVYFSFLDGAPAALQQGAYGIGKTVQFALPVVWVCCVRREWQRLRLPSAWSLIVGLLFGAVVGALMAALYFGALKPAGLFDEPSKAVLAKVKSFGAGSPIAFLALGVFYSAVHSLFEEYYWRWFVFGQLARGCRLPTAIIVSSVAFAAHHVLVLGHYFGYSGSTAPLTWLFTLAIVIGGGFWAWLYQKSESLAAPWLSHALIDAAIFAIGYRMITS